MKGVKILGLVEMVYLKISKLRHTEVQEAKRLRIIYAMHAVLQTLSLSGTRWITYTCFGIATLLGSASSGLNITVLFTSLAILNIFMERLEILLRYLPSIASSFGCLHRIEVFLLLETKRDNRLIGNTSLPVSEAVDSYQLQDLVSNNSAISLKQLSIGWTRERMILQGLNLEIPHGSFTSIIGP